MEDTIGGASTHSPPSFGMTILERSVLILAACIAAALTGPAINATAAIDPPRIDRLALSADLIVSGIVESGGSFDALFRVDERIAGDCPDFIELFNSNRHPWNTMHYSWRTGARYVLLLTGADGRYCPLSPGIGVYRIDGGRIAASVSDPPLRYEIDAGLFIGSLSAIRRQYAGLPPDADDMERLRSLASAATGGAASDRHFASETLGNLFMYAAMNDAVRIAAEDALIRLASDRNPKLRQSAAASLARYAGLRCGDAAAALLNDATPTVAFSADRKSVV